MKTDSRHQRDYIIDVFDRASLERVHRLESLHGKPDIVRCPSPSSLLPPGPCSMLPPRCVSELGLLLLSYPSLLMVEAVRLEAEEGEATEYIDLARWRHLSTLAHRSILSPDHLPSGPTNHLLT